jgi:hypothetical protein
MTDDLAKQLRAARESGDPWAAWHLALQTADRIEKLEAELHHCFHRIEELQAALRAIIDRAEYRMGHHVTDAVCAIAREALEETK